MCLPPHTSHLQCRKPDAASPLQAVNKWVGIAGGEATNVLTRQLGALLVASAAILYTLKVSLLSFSLQLGRCCTSQPHRQALQVTPVMCPTHLS